MRGVFSRQFGANFPLHFHCILIPGEGESQEAKKKRMGIFHLNEYYQHENKVTTWTKSILHPHFNRFHPSNRVPWRQYQLSQTWLIGLYSPWLYSHIGHITPGFHLQMVAMRKLIHEGCLTKAIWHHSLTKRFPNVFQRTFAYCNFP